MASNAERISATEQNDCEELIQPLSAVKVYGPVAQLVRAEDSSNGDFRQKWRLKNRVNSGKPSHTAKYAWQP